MLRRPMPACMLQSEPVLPAPTPAHLGRSLPYSRQQLLPGISQRPAPKKPGEWEYTPFGKQRPFPEPPAPFQQDPVPDAPPVRPGPEPATLEPEPEQALQKPEPPARLPPRLHLYEDLPYDPGELPSAAAPRQRQEPRRLGRSVYDALETHGHYGLVDGGETLGGGVRRVVVHVPKRNRGYALDIKQGDAIYANSARGTQARGRLDVVFVSRHKYVPPGHAVTSCVVGVPEYQWRRFVEF